MQDDEGAARCGGRLAPTHVQQAASTEDPNSVIPELRPSTFHQRLVETAENVHVGGLPSFVHYLLVIDNAADKLVVSQWTKPGADQSLDFTLLVGFYRRLNAGGWGRKMVGSGVEAVLPTDDGRCAWEGKFQRICRDSP